MRQYLYQEKTSVFSYYILKTIFLYNYPEFLDLCKKMNINIMRFYSSPKSIESIIEFIKKYHNDTMFLIDLDKMKLFFSNKLKENKDDYLIKTLRMTVVGE